MIKLIKLEKKKYKFRGYLNGAIIATLVISFLICFITFVEGSNNGISVFNYYQEAFNAINILVGSTFIIFASVLISKLIVEEYKNRTISVLYTYPVNRKKLISAKLIIVVALIGLTTLISGGFVTAAFIIVDSYLQFVEEQLTMDTVLQQVFRIITNALAASGLSLIPLYFGMLKKSVPTTIISSLLIVGALNSNINGFSLGSVIVVPMILCSLGLFVAYLAIRNIEKEDIN